MRNQDTCPVCADALETMLHILHDCEIAKDLWKSVGDSVIKTTFFQSNLLPWLEENLFDDTRTVYGIEWPLLFSTTCNTLWYCKNLLVVEQNNYAYNSLTSKTIRLAQDYGKHLSMMAGARQAVPTSLI